MKFKTKSSPLKLLSQSQPNFAEMILGWSSSKLCLAFQNSDQDGNHSAVALLLKAALIQVSDYRLLEPLVCVCRLEKRGDEI